MNARLFRTWPRALALGAVLLAAPAFAQDTPWPPAPAPPPDSAAASEQEAPEKVAADTTAVQPAAPAEAPAATLETGRDSALALPMVLTLRSRKELEAEKLRMSDVVTEALHRVTARKSNATREQMEVDVKKGEIADLNKELDAAKKEKREGDKKRLEADKKKLEAQQKYLEKVRDWHAAEANFQESLSDYAQARIDEGEAELRMLDLGDLSSPQVRESVEARSAAARVLAAIKMRADMGTQLANDEKTAADKRKAVLDAYTTMSNL